MDRQSLINWITAIVRDLVENPDDLAIKATVDERGLLITIFASGEQLGQLIGKEGRTAQAIRTLASQYGYKHGARISVKIEDSRQPLDAR
jgi:predicted RNA-binding protein YlqC (UPF0109 family)